MNRTLTLNDSGQVVVKECSGRRFLVKHMPIAAIALVGEIVIHLKIILLSILIWITVRIR